MKIILTLRRRWILCLCIVGLLGFLINALTFYPGYMSNDTITQLRQALGIEQPDNMLPLAMVGVWRILIKFTHHVSSMMLFQLSLFWLSLSLLSVYIYRETKDMKKSLLPFTIGILPFILNISGVVWKDNQMAFSLLLACVGVLYFKYVHTRGARIALLSMSLILMIYAALVRYNAIVAIVPLMYLAVSESGLFKKRHFKILVTMGTVGATVIGFSAIGFVMNANRGNPTAFVMIDDIANVTTMPLINSSNASGEFKSGIKKIKECAAIKGSLVNNYWICSGESQREKLQRDFFPDLKSLWVNTIFTHPLDYVLFKLQAFESFLLPREGSYYVWQNGIESNDLGQSVKNERLGAMTDMYVNDFGYKYFKFMYEPWFWLVVCGMLSGYVLKKKTNVTIITLVSSAILYIFSYLPTGATVDYRFIYWSVIACLVAIVLLVTLDNTNTLQSSTKHKTR